MVMRADPSFWRCRNDLMTPSKDFFLHFPAVAGIFVFRHLMTLSA
jgi:hypothetical protein